MTTQEDHEVLTRVGPGTLLGDLFRQYQIPVPLSTELEPSGPPKRVRLLGEDLVAFRSKGGNQVGLVGEFCSHRRASLYFGRIEEEGIRCVYHGWKYGLDGQCLEMANVPAQYDFKDQVQHPAYPCIEKGGIVWAYMGPKTDTPPAVPDLEFLSLPEENRCLDDRVYQYCNWLQALEGGIDPTHAAFLHGPIQSRELGDAEAGKGHGTGLGPDQDLPEAFRTAFSTGERTPHVEFVETEYGVMLTARRQGADQDKYLYRVNQFLMPFYTMPPVTSFMHMWVPVDDENMVNWRPRWNLERAMTVEERQEIGFGYLPSTPEAYGDIRLKANKDNNYFMDWEIHKTRKFGIPTIGLEDVAVQESMGPIVDRTKETLNQGDAPMIAARKMLVKSARTLRDTGTRPPGTHDPAIYRVRGLQTSLSKDVNWVEGIRELFAVGSRS